MDKTYKKQRARKDLEIHQILEFKENYAYCGPRNKRQYLN